MTTRHYGQIYFTLHLYVHFTTTRGSGCCTCLLQLFKTWSQHESKLMCYEVMHCTVLRNVSTKSERLHKATTCTHILPKLCYSYNRQGKQLPEATFYSIGHLGPSIFPSAFCTCCDIRVANRHLFMAVVNEGSISIYVYLEPSSTNSWHCTVLLRHISLTRIPSVISLISYLFSGTQLL